MKKEAKIQRQNNHINKNVIAVLLIIAIIISLIGTYMTIVNINNTPLYQGETHSSVGKVGVYVNNPNIPETKEEVENNEASVR